MRPLVEGGGVGFIEFYCSVLNFFIAVVKPFYYFFRNMASWARKRFFIEDTVC